MPYCPDCGQEVSASDRYCQNCGYQLSANITDSRTVETTATETVRTPTESESQGYSAGQKAVFLGTGLTVIGAFLPWFTIEVIGTTLTKRGIQADGIITLLLALVVAAGAILDWGVWAKRVAVICGLIIAGLSVMYIAEPLTGTDVSNQFAEYAINVGLGLYLTAFGGLTFMSVPVLER